MFDEAGDVYNQTGTVRMNEVSADEFGNENNEKETQENGRVDQISRLKMFENRMRETNNMMQQYRMIQLMQNCQQRWQLQMITQQEDKKEESKKKNRENEPKVTTEKISKKKAQEPNTFGKFGRL